MHGSLNNQMYEHSAVSTPYKIQTMEFRNKVDWNEEEQKWENESKPEILTD